MLLYMEKTFRIVATFCIGAPPLDGFKLGGVCCSKKIKKGTFLYLSPHHVCAHIISLLKWGETLQKIRFGKKLHKTLKPSFAVKWGRAGARASLQ